ncbi:hypothetical protein BDZ97DRAFT_1905930 [Flammula alnicola]|nr:hypothetical protein BDZ97DRAFT_1905930 [Flammula alnicola]
MALEGVRSWAWRPCFRFRQFIIVLLAVVLLSFFFIANIALQDISETTISLERAHDPESHGNSASNTTARILLVSAMFPLPKSKHSKEDYAYWISKFLQPVSTDVYFYTPPDFAPTVRQARGRGLSITIDTNYTSPFDIPPLKGLEDKYKKMHSQDREGFRHSPELYAIWNAKPFLLDAAVKALAEKGEVYDYAFWNDAGSFREDHRYTEWPDPRRVDQIWQKGSELTGMKKDELLFFPLTGLPDSKMKYWTEDMGPVDYDISEGSFFGGTPNTVSWWKRTFYAYHDYYLSLGLFVGKDQTLINALFLLFPERLITVWYHDPNSPAHAGLIPYFDAGYLGACGAEWFYYQFWLSGRSTRDAMRESWISVLPSRWVNWEWWKNRQTCRLTGVLALKDVLQGQFGKKWKPPVRTIVVPGIESE